MNITTAMQFKLNYNESDDANSVLVAIEDASVEFESDMTGMWATFTDDSSIEFSFGEIATY